MSNRSKIGHNNPPATSPEKIKAYVERIEKAEQDKRDAATFCSGIYAELKSEGFDPKIIRAVVRQRRMTEQERTEQNTLLELYKSALGME